MRIARFKALGNIKYGLLEGDVVRGLQKSPFEKYMKPGDPFPLDGSTYNVSEIALLAPCCPSKYVGIGVNYRKMAERLQMPIPKMPILFLKPPTSVIGPNEDIVTPGAPSKVVHEGELALVIGKLAKDVPEDKAREYLLGFTCTNDVSDSFAFQEDGLNPTRAKARDTFGPLGPWIETEIDPDDVTIEVYVNNELRQSGSTQDFVFGINKVVSFVSSIMTLLPGDVIATGTPPIGTEIKPGDVVEVRIDKIGVLKNNVVGRM